MSTNVEQGVAHDEKSNFFIFLSKDTVWWSEKRGSVFLLKRSFEREKLINACFCPTVVKICGKKTCLTPSSKLRPV